jgi:CHAD domain-containing protein
MLLQQTSKYLMRAISKKFPALILDLAFVHDHQDPDFKAAALTLRTPQTLEALMKALFAQKYANAKATLAELLKSTGDTEEAWLHFHPRAGNALSITYGKTLITQQTSTFIRSASRRLLLPSHPASASI